MFDPEHYRIAAELFTRGLGLIYFVAFGAFLFQITGLIGERGIMPVGNFLYWIGRRAGKWAYFYVPSIFWFNCTNRALMAVTAAGTLLGALLFFYVSPLLTLIALYILYLSLFSVGQDFLSFGWELFLLEITVNAILLNMTETPNLAVWISLNLLLFRFHFQGGAVKLISCDVNWRNLTACAYHYQTQPIPNATAWYVHKFPAWFHKFSTAFMFFVELVVPFFIFAPWQEVRLAAFFFLAGLQLIIYFTGNFSFLNHLTLVFLVILVSDHYFSGLSVPSAPPFLPLQIFVTACASLLILLQLMTLWHHLYRPLRFLNRLLQWVQPFHLAVRYGIFAVMTTKRYEVVVEGSDDGVEWKEYLFYYKPSELERRPRRISPYQPRIDWQIWFLPFSNFEDEEWFQNFLVCLLKGTPEVLNLLRYNPFPEKAPKYVRALFYDYVFSDWETKRKLGHWWQRTLIGQYAPTISLKKEYD